MNNSGCHSNRMPKIMKITIKIKYLDVMAARSAHGKQQIYD